MRSHLAVWLVCGSAATWAGEGASAPPATQVALDWNRMWEGVLAACAGMEKDHPSVAAFRAGASADTGNKELAAWKYEANVEIDYDRGMACKRKNPAGPYYHVRLSIHGIRTRGFTEVAPDKPSVAWDGKSSRREYGIPWMKLGIGLTVLSDDPDFVKAINAILDQEITRALRRSAGSATQPAAGELDTLLHALGEKLAGTWAITVDRSGDRSNPYGWVGGKGAHLVLHYQRTLAPGAHGRRAPELWIMEWDNPPRPHNDSSAWSPAAWSPARQIGVWRRRHVFCAPFGWGEPSEEHSRLVADIQAVIKGMPALPATQPEAARAGRLAKSLKANRAGFALAIEYRAPEAEMESPEKGDYTLTLSAPRPPETGKASWRVVQIAEAEADRIIDYLAAEEAFLGKADDVMGKGIGGGPRPGCTWLVWGANEPMLHQPERLHPMLLRESIPAGPKMLARLDGLRNVLDGEVAKAMDQLLQRLGPHRKDWEKAHPTVE